MKVINIKQLPKGIISSSITFMNETKNDLL